MVGQDARRRDREHHEEETAAAREVDKDRILGAKPSPQEDDDRDAEHVVAEEIEDPPRKDEFRVGDLDRFDRQVSDARVEFDGSEDGVDRGKAEDEREDADPSDRLLGIESGVDR